MVFSGGNELLSTDGGPMRDYVATSWTVLPLYATCRLIMRLFLFTFYQGHGNARLRYTFLQLLALATKA